MRIAHCGPDAECLHAPGGWLASYNLTLSRVMRLFAHYSYSLLPGGHLPVSACSCKSTAGAIGDRLASLAPPVPPGPATTPALGPQDASVPPQGDAPGPQAAPSPRLAVCPAIRLSPSEWSHGRAPWLPPRA